MKKLALLALLAVFVAALASVSAQENSAPPMPRILVQALAKADDPSAQTNILRGINAALKGKHDLAAPDGWSALYDKLNASGNEEVREQARALAAVFGGGRALEEFRKTLADPSAGLERRKAAMDSLVGARDAATLPLLRTLVEAPGPLRRPALRALAAYDDAKIPEAIFAAYAGFGSEEKHEALSTLASRPAWARSIVEGLDAKTIARSDVSTPLARQLADLGDPQITGWLDKNWGAMRSSPADKQQQIARLKSVLRPEYLAQGDPAHGRALFSQTCALCHTIFGAGAKIGPELPGAFEDIDYLLLNIVDPNAIIGKDYQQTVVQTKGGQTLVGIIGDQDASSVTLKSLAGVQTVQRADIGTITVLETSLMPEGLLSALKDEDVRDLFSYLRLHGQTPILASSANLTDFFNGADLSHWIPSRADAWRVENGELVGNGNQERSESLTSEMVVENCRLTAQIKMSGGNTGADQFGIVVSGEPADGGFRGCTLQLSSSKGIALRNDWTEKTGTYPGEVMYDRWLPLEVKSARDGLHLRLGDVPLNATEVPEGRRTVFAFSVAGSNTEMRIKDIHLEFLPK